MFDINNEQQRKDAYAYINGRIGGFYGSSMYESFWARCQNRLNAYYMRHNANQPVWRSKLYFATFFLGVQAMDAALSQSLRQDPIVHVGLEDGYYDPNAEEQAQIAHFDLNHDLYISRWKDVHSIISWYVRVFGTGVGREYIKSDVQEDSKVSMIQDQFGLTQEQTESIISRNEHTKTDAVHPLNFAHDATVSDFYQSRWASVRYPLTIADIYKMLGDDNYYQPGVKELLDKMTGDGKNKSIPSWSSSKDVYYCENETNEKSKNSVIVDEYSGDLNFTGNYDDNALYYGLYVRSLNITLAARKSPFRRHPYWKERCYPDPAGPYGVDPCAALLPVGYLKNSTFNQYVDWGNANLKTMYEVYDGNIRGGLLSVIVGQPHGFVVADSEDAYTKGPLIRPVQKDKVGISGISDILNYIDRYEQNAGPSSNLRGKSNDQLADTATGIGLMAQREDNTILAIQDKIDSGICDCMQQKLQNRIDFMTQPVTGVIQKGQMPMRYFPKELGGSRYTYKVNRITPDIQAGKYMAYLKTAIQFMNPATGGLIDLAGVAKLLKVVGRNMGIDEIDEVVKEPVAPNIQTQAPGMGIDQSLPPDMTQSMQPEQMGMQNAAIPA